MVMVMNFYTLSTVCVKFWWLAQLVSSDKQPSTVCQIPLGFQENYFPNRFNLTIGNRAPGLDSQFYVANNEINWNITQCVPPVQNQTECNRAYALQQQWVNAQRPGLDAFRLYVKPLTEQYSAGISSILAAADKVELQSNPHYQQKLKNIKNQFAAMYTMLRVSDAVLLTGGVVGFNCEEVTQVVMCYSRYLQIKKSFPYKAGDYRKIQMVTVIDTLKSISHVFTVFNGEEDIETRDRVKIAEYLANSRGFSVDLWNEKIAVKCVRDEPVYQHAAYLKVETIPLEVMNVDNMINDLFKDTNLTRTQFRPMINRLKQEATALEEMINMLKQAAKILEAQSISLGEKLHQKMFPGLANQRYMYDRELLP